MATTETTMLTAADHARVMADYSREGIARAMALGNRGPIKLDANGRLDPAIVDSYWTHGFYVFEGVAGPEELAELRADVDATLARAPASPEADRERSDGRIKPPYRWAKPLSDPLGGTTKNNGRHPVAMSQPTLGEDAPAWTVELLDGNLHLSDACLRLYGHPGLLTVAASILGDDFVPYNEVTFVKEPGLGPSVAWHQDGTTHWNSATWDEGVHGFNFMAQLYGCTAANGVWVVPGSHKLGKIDIKAQAEQAGTERLPDAVPILCKPGDVAMTNRQALHGSFANTSKDWRVTINFGFHRRRSVLGVTAGGIHNKAATYDAERIHERAKVIGYAIDARRARFPNEAPFVYRPHADAGETYRWDLDAKASLKDYNLLDLSI